MSSGVSLRSAFWFGGRTLIGRERWVFLRARARAELRTHEDAETRRDATTRGDTRYSAGKCPYLTSRCRTSSSAHRSDWCV